jgi:hypothetical protein
MSAATTMTAHDFVVQVEPLEYPGFGPDQVRLVAKGKHLWGDVKRQHPQPIGKLPSAHDASFVRVIDLPGCCLSVTLQAWWHNVSAAGAVEIDRHLCLCQPHGERGSWSISGRMRRPASWRWLPVELELWPLHDRWTRLTLVPRSRVRVNWMYFRNGNRSVDRFTCSVLSSAPLLLGATQRRACHTAPASAR